MRRWAYIEASGKSSETPPPPWTWIARSIDLQRHVRGGDLDAAISVRACLLPTVSISHAALSVSSRAISISMRDSAIQSWMFARVATGAPNVTREAARGAHQLERPLGRADRAHAVVDAARAEPGLRDREAVALVADQVRGGDADVLEVTSAWPSWSM